MCSRKVFFIYSSEEISGGQVESKVPEDGFQPLYELALRGCQVIAQQMRSCLLEHALEGFSLRQSRRKA